MSRRMWLYFLTISIGLWIAATGAGGILSDNTAEWPVNVWCWGFFIAIFVKTERKERIEMITVVALATPMELFFSEVWLAQVGLNHLVLRRLTVAQTLMERLHV